MGILLLGRPGPYPGFVATGGRTLSAINSAFKQVMSRSLHTATENMTVFNIICSNFHAALPDVGPGAAATVSFSIEYPIGVAVTRGTFSGSFTGTIPDGLTLTSDDINLAIPSGDSFAYREYVTNANGCDHLQFPAVGETMVWAASGLADQTNSAAAITGGTSVAFVRPPLAIVSRTTQKRSVLAVGDSRSAPPTGGNIGPSVDAAGVAQVNIAVSASTATQFIAHATARAALFGYGSQVIVALGINDMDNLSLTPAQAASAVNTLLASFSAPKKYVITIEPHTTSSNSWNSPDDQVSFTDTATFNNLIRAGLSRATGYYEVEDVVANSRVNPHWKVVTVGADSPPFTLDGLHGDTSAGNLILHSGVIAPASYP